MQNRTRLTFITGALAAILVMAYYLAPRNQLLAPNLHQPTPPPQAAPNPTRAGFFAPVPAAPLQAVRSMGQEIDQLTASGKPRDAFEAFRIADRCRRYQIEHRRNSRGFTRAEVDEACNGVLPRHLLELPNLLAQAVKARVPRALAAQYKFGPLNGDRHALKARPDDPSVIEWKRTMLDTMSDEAQRSGEWELLFLLTVIHDKGILGEKNPGLALGYMVAMQELQQRNNGLQTDEATRLDQELITIASEGLTPAQIEEARRFGKRLVRQCCT